MSLAKAQQLQKALQYIGLAEQQEGCCSALGCLIRLQVQLGQQQQQPKKGQGKMRRTAEAAAPPGSTGNGSEAAAAAAAAAADCITAVDALSSCTDFDNEAMQVGSLLQDTPSALSTVQSTLWQHAN